MATISNLNSQSSQTIQVEKTNREAQALNASDRITEVAHLALGQIALSSDGSLLEDLPDELKLMIVEKLDLTSVAKLRNCSQAWNQFGDDHLLWRSIANQIGCPINEDTSVRDQVGIFVQKLKSDLRKTLKKQDGMPILEPGNLLTIDQITQTKDFLEAYSIIRVWLRLARKLNPGAGIRDILGVSKEDIGSAACIKIAKGFNAWFTANQNELARLEQLDLSGLDLYFLPKEICDMTSLKDLNLNRNLLSSLPSEISKLTRLVVLPLIDNPLSSLPEALDQLERLNVVILNEGQFGIIPDAINDRMPEWKCDLVYHKNLTLGPPKDREKTPLNHPAIR